MDGWCMLHQLRHVRVLAWMDPDHTHVATEGGDL